MGRPEPCVLYAHTFVHPHLDEYVDEVLFSEPVVITACEFLEQNASSICPAVKLMGATSPPSFALEVFIHCEGETRFRRLCLPFLYSHSSSNVLEVEALVTNHLVVRGSYRSLSMVLYGNTAEDLGQFNIEVDLDSSLTETVTAVEGNMEDLPPAFRPTKFSVEELMAPLKILSHLVVPLDCPLELKQFLRLVLKILDFRDQAAADTVLSSLLSVASAYASPCLSHMALAPRQQGNDGLTSDGIFSHHILNEGKKLSDIYVRLQNQSSDPYPESTAESMFSESEMGIPTSKDLVDTLHQHFDLCSSAGNVGYLHLSQSMNRILWLSLAQLLCSARESCFHFVNYGGLKQLQYAFAHQNSSSAQMLLLLGVAEQATRHSIGCEGFLGWWPREDESLPSGKSDGYNQLLKLLLENNRHDVASLATYILRRIRFYEVACRYEGAVLSILGAKSGAGEVAHFTLDMLTSAKVQLKILLKMMKLSGPIDDPSPVADARRSIVLGDAGPLSYQATRGLINLSNCSFSNSNIDSHLLSLLKERGFLPLSAALLSSPICRSEKGPAVDLLVDIVSHIEAIILLLLFCRSGLEFLLHDPEVSSTVIRALRGIDDVEKEDPMSPRYASVLISKGYFCHPKEVGMIIQMHTRALIAVDSLCKLTPNTEEFLWVLWDLCRLSRTECGRQALLVLVNFPQALEVLIAALHSGREFDPVSLNPGISPLNLAIYHSVAEILEVIVTDSTANSLMSWIDHAKELHTALYSSSPGSNKKDAPARLLEWIDGGVVYHKNGTIGLLRYAAVLASGGDAHMASNSVLASDMIDVDNVVGDFSGISDGSVIDHLLGKRITEKDFPGVILRDSCIAQLTTTFRILAFISDNSVVATALYDEGAIMVVHAVLINCKLMFERSSNIYDYLVDDEGAESNSTTDLLIERNREKNLVDLLIPCLVLLINLLQKLQEAKEQHRNTKLMNALLLLHREVSPKLAACASELTHSCPESVLGFGAVCHLLASALACWPLYGWTPGLFHFLLESLRANSLLAMGPKETCSLFCLLNDLLPDESIWRWKNEMPMLSSVRSLAVGTLLGPEREKQVNWYLKPGHPEKLVALLSPLITVVGEIILHCAISMSAVIQDILRVFIIRIAFLNVDIASVLLKPVISWIFDHVSGQSIISEVDMYKVHQLLNFLGILVEHPNAKPLVLKEGGFQTFTKVLEMCIGLADSDVKQLSENFNTVKRESILHSWLIPVFKSITLICDSQVSVKHPGVHDKNIPDNFTAEECCIIWSYLLRFCMVLPVGRELVECLSAVKVMGSSTQGQHALLSIITDIQSSTVESFESQIQPETDARCKATDASEWKEDPPLLRCWTNLLRSIDLKDVPSAQVAAAVDTLSFGALSFCMDGKSLNMDRVAAIKFLFGAKSEDLLEALVEKSGKYMEELTDLLGSETSSGAAFDFDTLPRLYQVKETANLLLRLLQKSSPEEDATITTGCMLLFAPTVSPRIHNFADRRVKQIEDHHLDEVEDKFSWECPENLSQTSVGGKRKMSSVDGPNKLARGDNLVSEGTAQSAFSRGLAPVTTPSGPTRRDTFRQRKPNTSRPPSMHVDDYVARERNADGTNSSNVIAVPRIGPTSGRPPSIHVDEFMARQKDRHNVVGLAASDATAQLKTRVVENKIDAEKSSKPQQLKPDLDDDLQGIDIVFDAEESEPDDKMPFPQPDDILQQAAPVLLEQHSPHSVVEETESDANENSQFSRLGTPVASKSDENTISEFSSRMSASRSDMPLTREPSISSDKKFPEQSDDKRFPIKTHGSIDSPAMASSSGVSASVYVSAPSSSGHFPIDSNTVPKLYSQPTGTVPMGTGMQGPYGHKFPQNHPPLPPMPPPPTISPVRSQNIDYFMSQPSPFIKSAADVQSQVQSEYTSMGFPDMKFGRAPLSSPAGSTRPPPPLPPTPPPFSANSSVNNPTSQPPHYYQPASNPETQHNSTHSIDGGQMNHSTSRTAHSSYPQPPLMQPMLFRPGSMPVNPYGNSLAPHSGDNLTNMSQNFPVSMSAVHSIPGLTQLQPLQPPQMPRPPPQHLRPSVPISPQTDPGSSLLHGSLQMPAQSPHVLQQRQVSPAHVYYQTQQHENASHSLQQQQSSQRNMQAPADSTSQQQDPAASLQEFFRSPEAIQSLLSDRDKLCQLLEQHPKLMQMLQERLGQL